MLIGVVLVAAGVGQAVGPVLSGDVEGSSDITAEQAIILLDADVKTETTSVAAGDAFDSSGATAGVATVSDDGTSFSAAVETHVGRSQVIELVLDNRLENEAVHAVLTLETPQAIDVEVEENGSNLGEAMQTQNTWLLTIPANSPDPLWIKVESKDDAKPGFYQITGNIAPFAG